VTSLSCRGAWRVPTLCKQVADSLVVRVAGPDFRTGLEVFSSYTVGPG